MALHTPVAPNVHTLGSGDSLPKPQEPLRSMNREFQIRFTAGLLILLTTAAVVLAWINFQKERDFQIPSDGVWWVEQNSGGLVADRVEPNGPGDKAGIRVGDQLTAINDREVKDTPTRMRQTIPGGRMVEGNLFGDQADGTGRHDRDPGSGRAFTQLLAAVHCPDLSRHRALRLAAPLDGAQFDPLLHFLPGFVHFLRLQVQRKAERI